MLEKIKRRAKRLWKAVLWSLLLAAASCGRVEQLEIQRVEEQTEFPVQMDTVAAEEILEVGTEWFQQIEEGTMDDLEWCRELVKKLGEKGYVAVDGQNRVDMTHWEQAQEFCERVTTGGEDTLTITTINAKRGLTIYCMKSQGGAVFVARDIYEYQEGKLASVSEAVYAAEDWSWENGYMMFSGSYFSQEYYLINLSNAQDCVAFRVQPLDEECRRENEQYIFPIGYARNNLFLVDWSEEDFGSLNFYDLYDAFYARLYGTAPPYPADKNLGIGAVYRIPAAEFEGVIMTYLKIDPQTLRSKTIYHAEDDTYEYRPRGFYESEYPEYPYPEVVDRRENTDGTVTLTVNVVYPYVSISKVFAHEVVIRPLGHGNFQYVSNRIVPSEDNKKETWHRPRMTLEEWEDTYGKE